MEMSGANYCPHCGAEAQGDSLFCSNCGRPVVGGSEPSAPVPYLISPARIVLLSILTLGLYTTYWLYKTWKHYKEHTGANVYPIWHGLTSVVPVYGSFRAHAHLRIFGELASAAGLVVGGIGSFGANSFDCGTDIYAAPCSAKNKLLLGPGVWLKAARSWGWEGGGHRRNIRVAVRLAELYRRPNFCIVERRPVTSAFETIIFGKSDAVSSFLERREAAYTVE